MQAQVESFELYRYRIAVLFLSHRVVKTLLCFVLTPSATGWGLSFTMYRDIQGTLIDLERNCKGFEIIYTYENR